MRSIVNSPCCARTRPAPWHVGQLTGFDPEGDHYRLTREMISRRVNLAVPSDSTLLEKSIGAVPPWV